MDSNKNHLIKNPTSKLYQEGKITEDYSLYDLLHGALYLNNTDYLPINCVYQIFRTNTEDCIV